MPLPCSGSWVKLVGFAVCVSSWSNIVKLREELDSGESTTHKGGPHKRLWWRSTRVKIRISVVSMRFRCRCEVIHWSRFIKRAVITCRSPDSLVLFEVSNALEALSRKILPQYPTTIELLCYVYLLKMLTLVFEACVSRNEGSNYSTAWL